MVAAVVIVAPVVTSGLRAGGVGGWARGDFGVGGWARGDFGVEGGLHRGVAGGGGWARGGLGGLGLGLPLTGAAPGAEPLFAALRLAFLLNTCTAWGKSRERFYIRV